MVVVGAKKHAVTSNILGIFRGYDDQGSISIAGILLDEVDEFQSADVGHVQIGDDKRKLMPSEHLQGVEPAIGDSHLNRTSRALRSLGEKQSCDFRVLDDEDFLVGHRILKLACTAKVVAAHPKADVLCYGSILPMRRTTIAMAAILGCACAHRPALPFQGFPGDQGIRTPLAESQAAQADAALAKATDRASKGSQSDGLTAYLEVRRKYPNTPAALEALFRAGKVAYALQDLPTAESCLSELLISNGGGERAPEARLYLGLTLLQQKRDREAAKLLREAESSLSGSDRQRARDALVRAEASQARAPEPLQDPLQAALRKFGEASARERESATNALTEALDAAPMISVAQAWNSTRPSDPAWALLTYKMARIYLHLGDQANLLQALNALEREAPHSQWGALGRELSAKLAASAMARPRVVGALLPMTGRYQAFGESALRGLKLAFAQSGIEVVVKDTQGDQTLTGQLVEQLVEGDKVMAIIGPLLTDDARRAALVAEDLGVPLITLSRAEKLTDSGPHIFRLMVTNEQQADAIANYAFTALGFRDFAILYPTTAFGDEFAQAFRRSVERRGGRIRGAETYDYDQKTFTDVAKKLSGRYYLDKRSDYQASVREATAEARTDFARRKAIEKVRSRLEPIVDYEAMLIPDSWQTVSLIAPALAVEDIVTNACEIGNQSRAQKTSGRARLPAVTLLGPSTWSSPKGPSGLPMLLERGGKYVHCGVYVDAFFEDSGRQATRDFVSRYRVAYGDTVNITLLDAMAYDAAALVRYVMDNGRPQNREAFREQLLLVRGFQGATGEITFDDQREAQRQMFLLELTRDGIRELAPGQMPIN